MDDSAVARTRVGFIGLGRMGLPICRHIMRVGYELTVYNRSPTKAAPLRALGAIVAPTVRYLAEHCDVVLSCLDSVAASEQVFLDEGGVVAGARPGTILIDHSTIGPETARSIGAAARGRGLGFLDAPVSGGPEGAEQGTLTIMAGGEAGVFERALPILGTYGATIVRMGEVGTGSLTKLVNQLLTFVHGAAAAEALGLAERAGLDLRSLGEVLRVSFGQSRMLERSLARVLVGNLEAGAALRLYAKDLGLVADVGERIGASLPLTDAADRVLSEAVAEGLGDRDIAALILHFRPPIEIDRS